MSIVFTGDLFTGGLLAQYTYYDNLIHIDQFVNADLRVCNLEQATSDNFIEVEKCTLYSPEKGISFLIKNKVDIVIIANNHIQDKGKSGFKEGIRLLTKSNIKCVGAGINIKQAEKAIQLTNDLYIMAYCDNNKPYIRKVKIATAEEYGINPFSYEKVINDLERIPDGKQAILYLHWGKENVWFPPKSNIKLAKELLKHPKVHSIIGSHSHRLQGRLKYNNKYCFFSLGNFLFPDFFIKPRTQIVYPNILPNKITTTKEYHPVINLTLKKWKYNNRVSLILQLFGGSYQKEFVKQDKINFSIKLISGIERIFWQQWFYLLSFIYQIPTPFYDLFYYVFNSIDKFIKYSRIFMYFFIKNNFIKSINFLLIVKNSENKK